MVGQRDTGWDGTIPEFDMGPYVLDDNGMFRRKEDLGAGPQENDYLRHKPVLYRWLLHHQRGCCLGCGIPEWASRTRMHVHREVEPGGPYSIWNSMLLCPDCHSKRHSGHRREERPAAQRSVRRSRSRRKGSRRTRKTLVERLERFGVERSGS